MRLENQIESDIYPVTVSSKVDDKSGQPVVNQANKIPKTNQKEPQIDRGNPLSSEILELLQEFREILVDDELPRIWVSTVFILISLKTEIARICQRIKITRAPWTTADHKVLSNNCESRHNHRYAVVVQDLATQWIQAYPCETKTS